MSNLTWRDVRTARTMLHRNDPMEKVIEALGGQYTAEDIERDLRDFRIKKNEQNRKARPKPESRSGWRSVDTVSATLNISEKQRLDRDRRSCLLPLDLSLVPLGDPLPGYSALDQAPSIAASLQHDPLDDLIFRRTKVGARYG